ncbi:MAG: aminopeptidase [Candidatus Peregrinibacteria bacterium]|nr:aminopeptidase [Candidatus Peregrinibacteria bacterium]
MIDKYKLKKLADIVVNYSISLKKGERILLRGYGFESYPLLKEIYEECVKAGAIQIDVRFSNDELSKIFFKHADTNQLKHLSDLDKQVADSYDAMIQILADTNPYEMKEVDFAKLNISQEARKPLSDILHKKRWCLLAYPNNASAIMASRSLEEWEDFILDSCLLDWEKEEKLQLKFVDLMTKVKKIRIVGDETDLEVSVAGQTWVTCCGKCNLPDGEIFTSPIRDSVNGYIKYNVPTHHQSHDFNWVKLTLKDGKVVGEESDHKIALTKLLDTDKGSRYFGEFAFGLNDQIKTWTRQILFDEKMGKSLHMALGKCYDECPNGNDSSVHWDLIFNFKWANAEIYFDGKKVYSKTKWCDKKFDFLN